VNTGRAVSFNRKLGCAFVVIAADPSARAGQRAAKPNALLRSATTQSLCRSFAPRVPAVRRSCVSL